MSKLGYGKAIFFLWVLFVAGAIGSSAQTLTTLVNFDWTNGAYPYYSSLTQGTDGNFYGTTYAGGANGAGTVFKITPKGTLTTLYNFCSQTNCADGITPYTLVQATNGNLYGTTGAGGTNGYGTVFEITPGGTLTTLHSFHGADGSFVVGGLVQATNGNFYGTTGAGGTNGYGTVFEITPGGTLTTLHNFDGTDGSYPLGNLVQGTDGDFYGTTDLGGAGGFNDGTVFKITASGTLTTLHSFDGTDGAQPNWLTQATNGDFYGTTTGGGVGSACGSYGCGTVFEITPGGALSALHSFDGTDGYGLNAGLVQATDGNFYGTAEYGGTNGYGTVFEIAPGGTFTTLHSFDGTDGNGPNGLVQDTNGTFYATTTIGGANDDGTVFSLSVGLGPFVKTEPASGAVGTIVTILGNDLTGATEVTFNGTAAICDVVSNSEILTVVPAGATTGTVQVTTHSGTLKSNPAFHVTTQQNAPPVRIASLRETVQALVTAGTINATQGQSLLAPLHAALTESGEGHTPAAIVDLLFFIDRVGPLIRTSALGEAGARVLIDAALPIIVELWKQRFVDYS